MKKTFSIFILTLCMLAAPMGVNAQMLVFHLTGGAKSTIALPATFTVTPTCDKLIIDGGGSVVELAKDDVMCVTYRGKKGDVNDDETVDVADIATIIDIMAGKGGDDKAPKDVVAVDLGLPSGTKWANMNVGAVKPEDYGLFFAWGEATGYTSDTSDGHLFDWASYKWMNDGQSDWTQINKYQVKDGQTDGCWYDSNGNFIGDGKVTLDLSDDAASANWGGQWVKPTYEDMRELLDNTTSEWTTENGVNGRRFTSKTNGNSVFLPAAGVRDGSSLYYQSYGNYWSASVYPTYSYFARGLDFGSGYVHTYDTYRRCHGRFVRPVLKN